jgi:hypothetical protein
MDELLKQLPRTDVEGGREPVTVPATEGDILVGGKRCPPGVTASTSTRRPRGDWSIALSDQGVALGKIWDKAPAMKDEPWPYLEGYTKSVGKSEVARTPLKTATANANAENLTVSFKPAGDGATMTLAWGDKTWAVDIKPAK